MNKTEWAQNILQMLDTEYPDAGTMLNYSSQFELLLAVVLSAQCTDAQVNKVTQKMFAKYSTPEDFVSLDISEIEGLVHGVGLYKGKAKNIKDLSRILIEKYDGQVPSDFRNLIQLPGVGRKTANVVMSVAFNQPGLGVDTHVQRVANRIGIVRTKNPDQTERELKAIIPMDLWSHAHHLLIFHGRKICLARKPNCLSCVLESLCQKVFDR